MLLVIFAVGVANPGDHVRDQRLGACLSSRHGSCSERRADLPRDVVDHAVTHPTRAERAELAEVGRLSVELWAPGSAAQGSD